MGKDLIEKLKNDTTLETLNKIDGILEEAKDILDDALYDEGATVTERTMAQYFIGEYLDMVHDMISDDFGVTRHVVEVENDCEDSESEEDSEEEPDECDGDCDNCELSNSAPFNFHRTFIQID